MLVAIAVEQHLMDERWCPPNILQCIEHTSNAEIRGLKGRPYYLSLDSSSYLLIQYSYKIIW